MHLRSPRIHPSFRWPRRDVEGDTGRFSSGYELWVRARERVSPSGTESIAGARTQIRGALNVFSLRNARFSDCFVGDISYFYKKENYTRKYGTHISFVILIVCRIDIKYLYIHGIVTRSRCENYTYNALRLRIKLYRSAKFVEKRREEDIVLPRNISADLRVSDLQFLPRYPSSHPLSGLHPSFRIRLSFPNQCNNEIEILYFMLLGPSHIS